jgi:hypothetical protein
MSPSSPRWGHAWVSHCVATTLSAWIVVVSSPAFAEPDSAHNIVVRSYDSMGVPLATLERAESTVQKLLGVAGIHAGWRNCRTSGGPTSRSHDLCDDVLSASEVIVRIVRAPRSVPDAESLGYSHVDPYRRQGTLATVFADRIRTLAPSLRIDEGTLLGRAITHEVGHLLLGTLEHSNTGLMRGHWSTTGDRGSDWLFSSAEAARMHNMLAARFGAEALAVSGLRGSH